MKGHNITLLTKFYSFWNKGQVEIGGIKFVVMLELISGATSLNCIGVQVERKGMLDYRKLRHKFFEGMEEPIRVSSRNGDDRLSLPIPFGAICY